MITPRQMEQQITNRINNQSPTKYDIDFYRRKVNRLQNDCTVMQQDLNRARIRLRKAQDYQLKYELILKQNTNLQNQLDKREKELCQKKSDLETMKLQIDDKSNKGDNWSKQKLELQREIQKWKVKAEEAEEKRISFLFENKEKADLNQKRQLQGLKKQFVEKQQGYQFQIRQLKKSLSQKQNIEGVITNRVEKVRIQKDEEIRRLQQFIEKQRASNDQAYKEKSEQLDKLRDKFQKIFNFELQNLKRSLQDQDELFNIELNGFREMIAIKNDEISKLLTRLAKQTQQHKHDRQQLQGEVNMLREKLYVVQRENELQIDNLKERITKIHAADIQNIEQRYTSIVEGLKNDRKDFQRQLKQKDKIVQAQKREYERMKHQMHDRLKERDVRIQHLQQRIKQTADLTDNQMKNLHQSLHQIQSEKELMTTDYQTNVGFLNQQLSKLTVKNQILNTTVKNLHQQIVKTKKQYTEVIQDIQNRWRQQRREYEQDREKDREKVQKLMDEQRQRQREWRIREKHLQRLKEKEQRQKGKLQFIIQEMERDTERLNNYIKQLDDALKREFKKNQTSTLDTGGIRRELNSELERQKSQLQAIKRMEVDQLKRKMEIELTKTMKQNQKLQNDLQGKTIALQNLEQEFKRLQHINKNIDRINKEKLIQYQKKMATLNSEINLTQTLYDKFLENKARRTPRK